MQSPDLLLQDPFATRSVDRLRRRVIVLLSTAQVLSGLAAGSVVSVGSLMAVKLAGSDAWAGSVTTASTLGAAVSSLALARLAASRGRRISLVAGLGLASLGAASIVLSAVLSSFLLLLVGGALMGVGSAANLQARFAATDLSTARTRARDLALVVWMSTAGAVTGPNLIRLGAPISRLTGLPELAAVFLLPVAGMVAAMLVMWFGLRPDPLMMSRSIVGDDALGTQRKHVPISVAFTTLRRHPAALAALSGILVAHAVMVAVMSMTPVHMAGHGASITLVGLTVSLHIAGMYALSPVMGILADKLGAPAVLVGGLVVVLASTVLTGMSGGSDHGRHDRTDPAGAGLVGQYSRRVQHRGCDCDRCRARRGSGSFGLPYVPGWRRWGSPCRGRSGGHGLLGAQHGRRSPRGRRDHRLLAALTRARHGLK